MQNQQVYQIPQQNSVIIVGRLTRDPELKRTTTSKSMLKLYNVPETYFENL